MWFLRKTQAINSVTKNTWLFFFLFTVSVTLQVQPIYEYLNAVTGIRHIGWLISYASGSIAPYTLYRALEEMAPQPLSRTTGKRLYKLLVGVNIIFLLIFPQISQEPLGANEAGPYNIWIVCFRLTAWLYVAICYYLVAEKLYHCQQENAPLSVRMRWILLAAVSFMGASYFALRTPYLLARYMNPAITKTAVGHFIQNILDILAHARLGWIFFFIPTKVYEWLLKPFELIGKLWILLELTVLKRQLFDLLTAVENHNPLLPNGVTTLLPPSHLVSPTPTASLRRFNLDLTLYRTLITIIDAQKMLDDLSHWLTPNEAPHEWLTQVQQLQQAIEEIPQAADFDTLLKIYRPVVYHTRRTLKLLQKETINHQSTQAMQQAREIVEGLTIDFQQFTMAGFLEYLETYTGRKIIPLAIALPPFMYGAWVSDQQLPIEYIFYDANLSPVHQIHTQLHEIGHFLCGHKTLAVSEETLMDLIQAGLQHDVRTVDGILMRASHNRQDMAQEAEAEAVAMVVQAQVIAAERMAQLAAVLNDNTEAIRFLRDMGVAL